MKTVYVGYKSSEKRQFRVSLHEIVHILEQVPSWPLETVLI